MSETQGDLTALHDAMTEAIKASMSMLQTVKSYDPTTRDTITTPAVLIEAVEMKPGRKMGDGRLPVTVEFAAHCCLSVKTERVELEIRNFAAKLLQVVNGNKWGLADAVDHNDDIFKLFFFTTQFLRPFGVFPNRGVFTEAADFF